MIVKLKILNVGTRTLLFSQHYPIPAESSRTFYLDSHGNFHLESEVDTNDPHFQHVCVREISIKAEDERGNEDWDQTSRELEARSGEENNDRS